MLPPGLAPELQPLFPHQDPSPAVGAQGTEGASLGRTAGPEHEALGASPPPAPRPSKKRVGAAGATPAKQAKNAARAPGNVTATGGTPSKNQTASAGGMHTEEVHAMGRYTEEMHTRQGAMPVAPTADTATAYPEGPFPYTAAGAAAHASKTVIDLTNSGASSPTASGGRVDWDSMVCAVCARGDDEARLMICDGVDCGKLWHSYCLPPPLRSPEPPADDGQPWFCPACSQERACLHADIYTDLSVMSYLQHGRLPEKDTATAAEIKRIQKRAQAYEWEDGQLFRKPTARYPQRRRVPAPAERLPLVQRWHTDLGHVGVGKCVRMLANTYHWCSITSDVREVVSTCAACQAEKVVFKLKASLHPLPIPSFPFQSVSIDVLGPLRPTTRLMTHVVIAVDRFSRWVEAAAIPDARSETLARFFFDNVLARWGSPVTVMSDQAQAFKHGEFAALLRAHGVRQVFSSARHAQANGLAEAYVKFFMTSLRKSISDHAQDWDLFVPGVCRAARFTICASTRYAPIQLLTGRNARIATEKDMVQYNKADEEAEELARTTASLADAATGNMRKAQARQQADYDRRRPMDADSLPDSGTYVLVRRVRGDKCTKRCDGPFLCVGYNKGCTIALLESADGKRWTENIERIAPFQVPVQAPLQVSLPSHAGPSQSPPLQPPPPDLPAAQDGNPLPHAPPPPQPATLDDAQPQHDQDARTPSTLQAPPPCKQTKSRAAKKPRVA